MEEHSSTLSALADRAFASMPFFADSTIENRRYAKGKWNDFAQKQGYPALDRITRDQVQALKPGTDIPVIRDWMAEYCAYLLQLKKNDREFYSVGTLRQYLSGVHTHLSDKYKTLLVLHKDKSEGKWYCDLYNNFQTRSSVNAIKRGDLVEGIDKGLRLDLLETLIDAWNHDGTAAAMEIIAAVSLLYQGIGRGGEINNLFFKHLTWIDGMTSVWSQKKTVKQDRLSFYPAYHSPLACPYHSLAAYLITHTGAIATAQIEGNDQLFPSLLSSKNETSAASWLTKELKKKGAMVGQPGLHSQMIRHGATDDAMLNQNGRHFASVILGTIYRGGWDFAGDCEMMNYLFRDIFSDEAGKALARYPNACMDVAYPSLRPLFDILGPREHDVIRGERGTHLLF